MSSTALLNSEQLKSEQQNSARPVAARSAAPGLVHSLTSDNNKQTIDRHQMRTRRMRRAVVTSARLHQEHLTTSRFRFRCAMVTLTYAPDIEWQPHHISGYLKNTREWLRKRGFDFRYAWVCELTQAGVPHYHVLIWLPRGITLPMPDKSGWWPYGMSRSEWARRPVGYLAKYASKGQGQRFPRGLRIHGIGGLNTDQRMTKRWWLTPRYVREQWPLPEADVHRAVGGGWVSRLSGDWLPSPWAIVGYNGPWVTIRWKGDGPMPVRAALTVVKNLSNTCHV